jgi:hypothetical protein
MKKQTKRIWKNILQLVLIMAGVFLGIVAGNWNEQGKSRKLTRLTVENLIKEMEGNRIQLKESVVYHFKLAHITDSLMTNLKKDQRYRSFYSSVGFYKIKGYTGPGIAQLETSVFETAKISNVFINIPIDLLEKIFRTYSYQEKYDEISKILLSRIATITWDTKTIDVYITLELIKGELSTVENKLMKEYEMTLEQLKKY